MRLLPFQLLMVLVFAPGTQAQTARDGAATPGSARVRFVSLSKMPDPEYEVLHGEVKTAVSISHWNISPAVELPSGVPCKLLRKAGGENLADFRLLAGKKNQLAVIIPAAQDRTSRFKVVMLDVAPTKLRGGERYAINISALPVVVRFGNTRTRIEAGAIGKIKAPRGKDGDFVPVRAVFYNGQKKKLFMSSRWVRDSRARTLLFIYPDAGKKSLSWHGLEVPPPAAQEDTPKP